MGVVLDYIVKSSDGTVRIYDSQKRYIDESEHDTFGEFDEIKGEILIKDKAKVYGETLPNSGFKNNQHHISEDFVASKKGESAFKYFLDGTRHIYKVGDIAINGVIYPLAVGQIIVGYCCREGRNIKEGYYNRLLVLALPRQMDINHYGENFWRKKLNDINETLKNSIFYKKAGMLFDAVIPYAPSKDTPDELGRNKHLRLAIASIQNEMLDQERLMVELLVLNNLVSNDGQMLIKDGSIEYKKDFTNRPDKDLASAAFAQNFRDVVGVSKCFDPELLSRQEPRIGTIIAELQPCSRTRAYRYIHEGKSYCVWYLRLRDTINRANSYSDTIKVEMFMDGDKPIQSKTIDTISAHLINEAYPVCYGKDSRWANHLYPIHVTEVFCKSMFMHEQLVIKAI